MTNNNEFQIAAEILPFLENIPNIDEGGRFIKTYIGAVNYGLRRDDDDPLDYHQVIRFIIQVDDRFSNMV